MRSAWSPSAAATLVAPMSASGTPKSKGMIVHA